jgi:phytoene dehydrogenase-like protein
MDVQHTDFAVVGAGFGGIGCALELTRRGRCVTLIEALTYPGGCASTFRRGGHAFESGATLIAGLEQDQWFGRTLNELGITLPLQRLDPVLHFRSTPTNFFVPASKAALVQKFCDLSPEHSERVHAFFRLQSRVAAAVWDLLQSPSKLPPFGLRGLLRGALRSRRLLPHLHLYRWSLRDVLARFQLLDHAPLLLWLNATCQITVQASAEEAQALFGLAIIDYYFRGAAHIEGGVGTLASALVEGIQAEGGSVLFGHRVREIRRDGEAYLLMTQRRTIRAKAIVLNLLPAQAERLLSPCAPLPRSSQRRLRKLTKGVESGFGAAMLYRVLRDSEILPGTALHVQVVADTEKPLLHGNHVFCSLSAPHPSRSVDRTLTISTHVQGSFLQMTEDAEQGLAMAAIQDTMRATLLTRLPEWEPLVQSEMTASPRTFERFVGRPLGFVGGVPKRKGQLGVPLLHPRAILRNVYLVGDSLFPGQSTLACALGGTHLATRLAVNIPL